jgi:short-subunit dehydrogenase
MSYPVEGKVVLITGPARGIGAETARRLARRGARLSLVGMEPEKLRALAAELGEGHAWFECDVTEQPALERAVAGTVEALGGIDVVVANAGIASHGTVAVSSVEALVRTIEVNLIGVVRTVYATLPHVTTSEGYYLLISSAAAFAALPGMSTYAASKSGVEQFGNVLRLELLHKNVRVGVAHPSWINTDLVRDAQEDMKSFSETLRTLPGAFGVVTSVEDCAAALVKAIERRRRKVYVPSSLAGLAAVRQFLTSRASEYIMRRQTRRVVPKVEDELRALGRSFGAHSVELSAKPMTDDTPEPQSQA